MLLRQNPTEAPALQAINESYAKFLRLENAAARIGAKEGVFSPAQMNSAVKQMSSGRDFARGDALMQDLATQGQKVLGSTVPDSGTPFRLANALALGGGYMVDPSIAAGTLAASAAYTPAGQKMMAALLASRPAGAAGVAQEVQKLGPLAAALLASGQR
jgi:heme oxygenase